MTVYFDNASTTRIHDSVIDVMNETARGDWGNPSSSHALGRHAKKTLETARKALAETLGAKADEIFFTSGGTEADNWALFGAAELLRHGGRHLIISKTEHDAVLKPAARLQSLGWSVTALAPDKTGRITAEAFSEALCEDTAFASVMLVNNETGAVNPIAEMTGEIKRRGLKTLFHSDAVQAFGKIPFSVKTLGVDLLSVSAHKIHGPRGIGALYVKKGLRLPPLFYGGGQEGDRRSGTEPLPLIVGLSTAARLAANDMNAAAAAARALYDRVVSKLHAALPEAVILSPGDCPYILSLSLPGYKSEVLLNVLDGAGICVSKGSACKKGARSHVLEAMRLPNDVIDGALRISFSRFSTADEADYFVTALCAAAARLVKVK
ncbi:cysteine desulfurase family protein [Oscillospiraceae bacterium WX1]